METFKKVLSWMGVGFILAAIIYGFLIYFVTSVSGGEVYDGLGRKLHEAPEIIEFIEREKLWPGLWARIFDWLVFFGGFGLGTYFLYLAHARK